MRTFRIIAIFVAVFILVGIVEALLGLRNHRFHRSFFFVAEASFVPFIAATLLLMNPKNLKTSGERFCYLATLCAVNLWYSVGDLRAVVMLFHSVVSLRLYGIIALDWLILAVLWGTFVMAWAEHSSAAGRKRRT